MTSWPAGPSFFVMSTFRCRDCDSLILLGCLYCLLHVYVPCKNIVIFLELIRA